MMNPTSWRWYDTQKLNKFTVRVHFTNLKKDFQHIMFYLLLLSLVGVFFLLSTYFLLTADMPQNARSGRQFVTQPLYYGATLLPNPGLFAGVNPFNRGVVDMNAACLTPEKQLVYWFPFLNKMPCHYTLILMIVTTIAFKNMRKWAKVQNMNNYLLLIIIGRCSDFRGKFSLGLTGPRLIILVMFAPNL